MAAKLLIMFALVAVLMCGNVEARAASATVNCTELEPLINALVSYKVYQSDFYNYLPSLITAISDETGVNESDDDIIGSLQTMGIMALFSDHLLKMSEREQIYFDGKNFPGFFSTFMTKIMSLLCKFLKSFDDDALTLRSINCDTPDEQLMLAQYVLVTPYLQKTINFIHKFCPVSVEPREQQAWMSENMPEYYVESTAILNLTASK